MKKMMILLTMSLSFTMLSVSAHEHQEVNQILKGAKEDKPMTKKSRRRKKVEMCHECGKPEVQCDCEGHNDNPKKEEKK